MRATWALLFVSLASARAESYCFGFLNAHPDRKEIPEAQAQEIQKGHLAHMNRMAIAGHLVAAGPMATPGGPRGIIIYHCSSIAEAQERTALDPAVANKRLTPEFYRWNGPDGIGKALLAKLQADPNTKLNMVQLPFFLLRKTDKWGENGPAEPVLAEHFKQVMGLRTAGKLRMAGPFQGEQGKLGTPSGALGVFVFAAMPLEDAKAIAERDMLVRDGYASLAAYMWYVADEAIPK
jgi:uncharacterized protein YciI